MSSQSLADTQNEFWRALKRCDNNIVTRIHGGERFKPEQRVEVYRTNARSLHVSVLVDVFCVCEKILGNDYFKQIAKNYFNQHPSQSSDLNEYGKAFPKYLQSLILKRPELKEFQYLADLAHLEWNIQKAHFSKDNINLDVTGYQKKCAQDGGNTVLLLQPSVSVMSSMFPVTELWGMHQSDEREGVIESSRQCQYLCIHRKEFQVSQQKISADVYILMKAMQDGKNLLAIAELFDDNLQLNAALEKVTCENWLRI